MNDDPEHRAQEPFFLGEAAALYDTKAGEAGITYAWELGDQETIGTMFMEAMPTQFTTLRCSWRRPTYLRFRTDVRRPMSATGTGAS